MSLSEKDQNKEAKLLEKSIEKIQGHDEEYFWDAKKLKVFDLNLFEELSAKEIASKVKESPLQIVKWMNHSEFRKQYDYLISLAFARRKRKVESLYDEFMQNAATYLRDYFTDPEKKGLDPNKVFETFRKFLAQASGDYDEKGKSAGSFIIAKDSQLNIMSEKAARLMEEAVKRERGFKELKISKEEEDEIKKQYDEQQSSKSKSPGD